MVLTAGFFMRYKRSVNIEKEIAKYDLDTLPIELLKEAKVNGFSDEQISRIMNMAMKKMFIKKKSSRYNKGI